MSSVLNKSEALRLGITAIAIWTAFLVWTGYLLRSGAAYRRTYFQRIRTLTTSPMYHPGDVVNYADYNKMLFVGWSGAEPGFRWSEGHQSGFVFRLEGWPPNHAASQDATLRLRTACALGPQPIAILVNDRSLANLTIKNGERQYNIRIPQGLMHNGANSLEFTIPGAHPPGIADKRVLGICLKDLTILPEGAE